jgi:hypothetical protein
VIAGTGCRSGCAAVSADFGGGPEILMGLLIECPACARSYRQTSAAADGPSEWLSNDLPGSQGASRAGALSSVGRWVSGLDRPGSEVLPIVRNAC